MGFSRESRKSQIKYHQIKKIPQNTTLEQGAASDSRPESVWRSSGDGDRAVIQRIWYHFLMKFTYWRLVDIVPWSTFIIRPNSKSREIIFFFKILLTRFPGLWWGSRYCNCTPVVLTFRQPQTVYGVAANFRTYLAIRLHSFCANSENEREYMVARRVLRSLLL